MSQHRARDVDPTVANSTPDAPSSAGEVDSAVTLAGPAASVLTLPLHRESVTIEKELRRTLVRAVSTTSTRDVLVEADLARDTVVVERVAIGRVVDDVPAIRQEGDVTILSIVEEEVVVTRRLILKEELHLRRVRSTEHHVETVTVREQHVAVTRTELQD